MKQNYWLIIPVILPIICGCITFLMGKGRSGRKTAHGWIIGAALAECLVLIPCFYARAGLTLFYLTDSLPICLSADLAGMIFGSLSAIKENDIRRMIAYSSVAQIGYIYMGIGMGTQAAMLASVYHILMHGATNSSSRKQQWRLC